MKRTAVSDDVMIHQLIPHFILENFAQGQMHGRFPATAVFVDISGFSAITETLMLHGQHGAEVLATVMRAIFDPLVESIYDQGGSIVGFAGDAFTAVFQDETNEQTAFRALTAGWQIQAQMKAHPHHETPYGTFTFAAKVGIASGEVVWGILRSEDGTRATFYCQGTAVDGCAHAEHQADQGEIILDQSVYLQAQGSITAEPVGDHFRVTAVDAFPFSPSRPTRPGPINPDHLSLFYPRDIITQDLSGEFRQVVNAFISLPGVHSETQLAHFMQVIFALQEQYGGLLNRVDFGDKGCSLFLFWGAPISYENDIERALNFVLALQTETSIPVSAGMTYCIAHAGYMGSPVREEYTCYSEGVNLAARLMTTAPRGEIWLDEELARRARHHFEVEFVGEKSFKGFVEKQAVYLLLEHKETVEPFYQGEMVGRQAELAQLTQFVQPLFNGRFAGTLVIWGEAGLGKSRLVHTFQTSEAFETTEVLWALCQTDQILRQSLHPFRYWLRHYFEQSATQSEARNKRSFNRTLENLMNETADTTLRQELARTRSFLGAMVNLYWPDSLYEEVDPQGRFENTLAALKTLLKAESLRQPVIIHLEDAHWLDADSKQFLQMFGRNIAEYPIALIATARPEQTGSLLGEQADLYQEMNLGTLSHDHLKELAEHLLEAPVAPSLVDLLVARAEGNPFFAGQILLYLREEGALEKDAAGIIHELPLPESPLPTDVRAVLVARLDRLAQEVKEVVQTAAVLGREFEVQLLAHMLKEDTAVPHHIQHAEQAAIWAPLTQLRYLFKHALLHDAAYKMQLHARRQQLHQLAAESLEILYAADLYPRYGELAYHYEQAHRFVKAVEYLEKAGDAANNAYQNETALDYYGRLLAILESEGDTHQLLDRPMFVFLTDVLLRRGKILQFTGQWVAAEADFRKALELAISHPDRRAMTQHALSELLKRRGDYNQALAFQEQALVYYEATGKKKETAEALSRLGMIHARVGDYEKVLAHSQRGLQLAQEAGDNRTIALNVNNLAAVHWYQQDYDQALAYCQQAAQLFLEAGDKRNYSVQVGNAGLIYQGQGDFEQALTCFQNALQMGQELGIKEDVARYLNQTGTLFQSLGEEDQALAYYQQALQLNLELGTKTGIATNMQALAEMFHARREDETALAYYEQAIPALRDVGMKYYLCETLLNKADLLFLSQEYEAAWLLHEEGVQIATEVGRKDTLFRGQVLAAKLAFVQGKVTEARQKLLEGLATTHNNIEQAILHDELWRMGAGDSHAQQALTLYRQVVAHTPEVIYKRRMVALETAVSQANQITS